MEERRLAIKPTDSIKAFQFMLLVQPTGPEPHPDILIIGESEAVKRGVVIDTGTEVPELEQGDLVYFLEAIPIEDGVWAVHFEDVISYKRYE